MRSSLRGRAGSVASAHAPQDGAGRPAEQARCVKSERDAQARTRLSELPAAESAHGFKGQLPGRVLREEPPGPPPLKLRGGRRAREAHPLPLELSRAQLDQLRGARTPLPRSRRRPAPDRHGPLKRQHGVLRSDAEPQVPVVYPLRRMVEHAHTREARATEEDAAARDEVLSQKLPEDVPLRAAARGSIRGRLCVVMMTLTVGIGALRLRGEVFEALTV